MQPTTLWERYVRGLTSVSRPAILGNVSGGEQPPRSNAEVAQLVEHLLAKEEVAGSNPVFRSVSLGNFPRLFCHTDTSFSSTSDSSGRGPWSSGDRISCPWTHRPKVFDQAIHRPTARTGFFKGALSLPAPNTTAYERCVCAFEGCCTSTFTWFSRLLPICPTSADRMGDVSPQLVRKRSEAKDAHWALG